MRQREELQCEIRGLKKAIHSVEREAARAEQQQLALESELGEHLQRRHRDLKAILAGLAIAPRGSQDTAHQRIQDAQVYSSFAKGTRDIFTSNA